jgi:hypothetical protein
MVTLDEIQAVYYMVAATGVLVAAGYYVLNMKATLETRQIGLIQNISTNIANEEGQKRYFELMNYEWTDYEDFVRKYDSENNPDAAAKRYALWNDFNTMGMIIRKGLVKAEDLYNIGFSGLPLFWEKYKPIVEEVRRRYNGSEYSRDMEFLAGEMLRYVQSKDPSYRVPEKLEKYDSDK